MRRIVLCLLTVFAFAAPPAFAGGGHDHGPAKTINQAEATQKATSIVAKLVQKGKLENSWAKVKTVDTQKKQYKKGPEWVVTFNNPQVENSEKQTLYVFLSSSGKYLAANFSGK